MITKMVGIDCFSKLRLISFFKTYIVFGVNIKKINLKNKTAFKKLPTKTKTNKK